MRILLDKSPSDQEYGGGGYSPHARTRAIIENLIGQGQDPRAAYNRPPVVAGSVSDAYNSLLNSQGWPASAEDMRQRATQQAQDSRVREFNEILARARQATYGVATDPPPETPNKAKDNEFIL